MFFLFSVCRPSASALTPQVQVVNGRIVINQQSLVVGAQESTREDTESYRRVEETRSKLNYNSYSNRTPVERWRKDDTELFYKVCILTKYEHSRSFLLFLFQINFGLWRDNSYILSLAKFSNGSDWIQNQINYCRRCSASCNPAKQIKVVFLFLAISQVNFLQP